MVVRAKRGSKQDDDESDKSNVHGLREDLVVELGSWLESTQSMRCRMAMNRAIKTSFLVGKLLAEEAKRPATGQPGYWNVIEDWPALQTFLHLKRKSPAMDKETAAPMFLFLEKTLPAFVPPSAAEEQKLLQERKKQVEANSNGTAATAAAVAVAAGAEKKTEQAATAPAAGGGQKPAAKKAKASVAAAASHKKLPSKTTPPPTAAAAAAPKPAAAVGASKPSSSSSSSSTTAAVKKANDSSSSANGGGGGGKEKEGSCSAAKLTRAVKEDFKVWLEEHRQSLTADSREHYAKVVGTTMKSYAGPKWGATKAFKSRHEIVKFFETYPGALTQARALVEDLPSYSAVSSWGHFLSYLGLAAE